MNLTGALFIGSDRPSRGETFTAYDPASGETLDPAFSAASTADVEQACALAAEAFDSYSRTTPEARAAFLEAIAEEIEALGDQLITRACAESGLPQARITGERGRTAGQLRLFAKVVRDGGYLDLRIDPALPERTPPRSDLRLRKVPLGPVAVFGASNFPLAFSVAGGDTASALAAGCPIVVKGHPAHPGTSELVASAIAAAVKKCGLHPGTFSLLNGTSNELGAALVADPRIKAVGFTGSRGGGLALMRIAQDRPEPIPVYAEMSSVNPVLALPAALANRGAALGEAYVASVTLGAGQFCTNPGLLFAIEGPGYEAFTDAARTAVSGAAGATMLTSGIHKAFTSAVERLSSRGKVTLLGEGPKPAGANCARASLFEISADDFAADPENAEEMFGSSSVIVRCSGEADMRRAVESLEGQLTATLQMDEADYDMAARFVPLLERKAGRILANGWPTGVEVTHAMVHGGPFPATSDGRSTSVGTLAIDRYLRPVSYQDLPQALLPEILRDGAQAGVA